MTVRRQLIRYLVLGSGAQLGMAPRSAWGLPAAMLVGPPSVRRCRWW
jgi:hypothetical protein